MDMLIYNGLIVTMDADRKIWQQGAVVIREGRILDIGPQDNILNAYADVEKVDAKGKAVLPGLVNIHSHTAMSALRGMTEDLGRRSLYDVYTPFTELMTREDIFLMSRLGCLETLKSGTTCLVENYSDISTVVEALDQIGIRAMVSEIVRDADFLELKNRNYCFDPRIGEKFLQQGVDLIEKWHGKHNGRILCQMSAHAPDLCSANLLKQIRVLAEKYDVGVHFHLSQNPGEVEQVLKREGKKPAEYLESVGLVGPRVIAAHCFLSDQQEVEILGRSRTNIAHCSGIAGRRAYAPPIWDLKQAGANITLGSDNMTGDMVEAMRLALVIARVKTGIDTAMSSMEVLEAATINGAKALGLDKEIGSLEKGKKADIIMVDLKKAHLIPVVNAVTDLVHYGISSDVDTVIVDGCVLMEDRQVKTVNEAEILEQAQKTGERLWEKYRQKYR
jgi:5-methylthioadenosine/S-adenosylhomocysteine deaminase